MKTPKKSKGICMEGYLEKYHFLLFLCIHNQSTTTTPKCTLPQRLFHFQVAVNAFFCSLLAMLPHFQENIPLINLVSEQIYHQLNGILIPSSTSIGISALVPQMSFHRDTKWGIVKCWLFSQSNTVHPVRNHQSQHLGDNL